MRNEQRTKNRYQRTNNKVKKRFRFSCFVTCYLLLVIFFAVFSSCAPTRNTQLATTNSFASYRDIPQVTAEEIAAIEALKAEGRVFSYGFLSSTEAFLLPDGTYAGFTSLFCELLSGLFGIPFVQAVYPWDTLKSGLDDKIIDFTGEMTATPERRESYFMTHSIAERSLGISTYGDSVRFTTEQDVNGRRLGFLAGSVTLDAVLDAYPSLSFEAVDVANNNDSIEKLESGEIDAIVNDAVASYEYSGNPFIRFQKFFPLVYSPVSLTTANPNLEPVISVVNKYIEAGGIDKLYELYGKGLHEYAKYELAKSFTENEEAYIASLTASGSKIPVALEYDNYPISFYNKIDREFQGIAPDVLSEITLMTGIEFEAINNEKTTWSEIVSMITTGKAALVSELLHTPERDGKYLWSKSYSTSHYALLSRSDYPYLEMYQVVRAKVGVTKGSAYEEMYNSWFPNNHNVVHFGTVMEMIKALETGKIDLMMASENTLITIINFLEMPGFKVNVLFNTTEASSFGFNVNEVLLCSIFQKIQGFMDADKIGSFWTSRMFDYSRKLAQARRPWLIGATGLFLAVLALIMVLLNRSRLERKRLANLVAEVKAANRAKSAFLANMSHEMRTPMNVIVGLTDLMLEEEDGVSSKVKEELKKINTAGNTLLGIINDVLDISKIEAGRQDLNPVQYDVASFLNDIITLNIVRIGEKPITFKLEISESMPKTLYGDDLRVKQVLNNLLSNAFKYTESGTVTLSVISSGVTANGVASNLREGDNVWVTFSISDTGMGIRDEDIKKLFNDYNQVNTSANRKIEGTGLGLSITKKFVEMMGGEITVESEYGKGTTFRARILQGFVTATPIAKEIVENLRGFRYQDEKKQAQGKIVRADLSYARVLVVDDFPMNLDVAAGMLRKYKMQVDCVQSGQEAVDSIKAGEPVYNAVFMDHMMPGMDGVEATKLIRALGTEYAEKIPIIALTANAVAGSEQMFLANGFNAFLPKPFNAPLLDSVIKQWVKNK